MNIQAKRGDKVIITEGSAKNGSTFDRDQTGRLLQIGVPYTVKGTYVESWTTAVLLMEKPGYIFNSVNFEDYVEPDVERLTSPAGSFDISKAGEIRRPVKLPPIYPEVEIFTGVESEVFMLLYNSLKSNSDDKVIGFSTRIRKLGIDGRWYLFTVKESWKDDLSIRDTEYLGMFNKQCYHVIITTEPTMRINEVHRFSGEKICVLDQDQQSETDRMRSYSL